MTSATPAPLPAPTADELAAVRARLDGRKRGTWWALGPAFALTLAAVVLSFLDLDGGDAAVETVWRRAWPCLLAAMLYLAVGRVVVALRTDRAVRARLASDGVPSVTPSAGRTVLGRREVLALWVGGAALVGVVGVVLLAAFRVPGVISWLAPVLLCAGVSATAAGVALLVSRPVVGTGPVLGAVHGALLRSDLHDLLNGASLIWPGLMVAALSLDLPQWQFTLVGLVFLALIGAPLILAGDRALLEDHRLPDAEPPDSWLARAAAA